MSNLNETAFPLQARDHQSIGLTKREYFASIALQGLRAAKLIATKADLRHGPSSDKIWSSKSIAKLAVQDADALIAELERKEETNNDK